MQLYARLKAVADDHQPWSTVTANIIDDLKSAVCNKVPDLRLLSVQTGNRRGEISIAGWGTRRQDAKTLKVVVRVAIEDYTGVTAMATLEFSLRDDDVLHYEETMISIDESSTITQSSL